MKSVAKKATIVVAILICIVLVATLIMGLIKIKPIDSLNSYDRVAVITSYDTVQQNNEKAIKDALKTVKFSALTSLFETGLKHDIKPVTDTQKDDDGEDEKINAYLKAADFSLIAAKADEFMLRFDFNSIQTNKAFTTFEGEKVRYDSIIMIIPKSDKKLSTVTLYPYIDFNIGNKLSSSKFDENYHIGSAYYKVYEFSVIMNTTDLYEKLSQEFKAGEYYGDDTNR